MLVLACIQIVIKFEKSKRKLLGSLRLILFPVIKLGSERWLSFLVVEVNILIAYLRKLRCKTEILQ